MAEQASSPPSSPPMASTACTDETPQPMTKRSHEQMNNDVIDIPASSHTFVGDDGPTQPYATAPSSMQPPARPTQSSGVMSPERAPTSGQGSVNVPRSQHDATQPAQPADRNTENEKPPLTGGEVCPEEGAASPDSSQPFDPDEKMQYFDWDDWL